MSILKEIKGLFSPAAIAAAFEALPELKTTIIDLLFPRAVEHSFAAIALAELETVVGTQPVVRRDGAPIPFQGGGAEVNLFAPRPLKPSATITAAELNDLKIIWGNRMSRDAYVSRKVDQLRRLIRNSAEGMAAVVATTGKLAWPSRLDSGGLENYELDFGRPARLDLPADQAWDAAQAPPFLGGAYKHLADMERLVAENGGGGNMAFLAGSAVFGALLALAERWQSTAGGGPISLKLEAGALTLGGYEIKAVGDRYQSPLDGAWLEKIPANILLGYSRDSQGAVYYLAADSLSLDGQAKSFHIVAETMPGDAAIRLIAQAKPVPARSPRSLVLSQVVGLE